MTEGPDIWAAFERARDRIEAMGERLAKLEARQNIIWALVAGVLSLSVAMVRKELGW